MTDKTPTNLPQQPTSMPPRKEVLTLRERTKNWTLDTLREVILQELFFGGNHWEPPRLSPRLLELQTTLRLALLPSLLQDLLNSLLACPSVEATVRFTSLQLLLAPGVAHLRLGSFPEPFLGPLLAALCQSGARLRSLHLGALWVGALHQPALGDALRTIHSIRHLTLRHTSSHDILATVGNTCPQLELLDIVGSEHVGMTLNLLYERAPVNLLDERATHERLFGFNHLVETLKVLDIRGTDGRCLPLSQVVLLLQFLPNLISLQSYERTGAAVEILSENNSNVVLKLTQLKDIYMHFERVKILAKLCSFLQSIDLDCPKGNTIRNLRLLKNLQHLKLRRIKSSDVEFLSKHLNGNLKTLYLSRIFGKLNLQTISNNCASISKLDLYGAHIVDAEPDKDNDNSSPWHFPNLRDLVVYGTPLTTKIITNFLTSSNILEQVTFGECNQTTDYDMKNCLSKCCFTQLESLWITRAENLSVKSILLVLVKSPRLTSIGDLAGWDTTPGETSFLRSQLALSNTHLVLHEIMS